VSGLSSCGEWFNLGPALSQFGNEYSIFWEILTIVIFWMAAFWALEKSEAKFITDKIKTGTEQVGGYLTRAAILEPRFIPVPGSNGQKVGIGALTKTFSAMQDVQREQRLDQVRVIRETFSPNKELENRVKEASQAVRETNITGAKGFVELLSRFGTKPFSYDSGLRTSLVEKSKTVDSLQEFAPEIEKALSRNTHTGRLDSLREIPAFSSVRGQINKLEENVSSTGVDTTPKTEVKVTFNSDRNDEFVLKVEEGSGVDRIFLGKDDTWDKFVSDTRKKTGKTETNTLSSFRKLSDSDLNKLFYRFRPNTPNPNDRDKILEDLGIGVEEETEPENES
jgi:hypothetical protein